MTKKSGYYQLDGDKLTKLVYEDRTFGRPIKAKNTDRVLFTRETFVEFPDYWVTDSRFSSPQRLTNANPQQAEFKWGHRILIDYKDKDGHKLQGTLAVPDDYQPGQKLPMLVYYYEKLSQNQNQYEEPRYASGPAYTEYVSNGYLVLLPDIYLHTGRTHSDHLNSVEAAVKRVVDLGYADPKRVGLHGGSFSGQGGAYIATQSKMFAAIAIRAAAVDLVADFNQLWKTSGTNQARYDTYGQGRFGVPLYDNIPLYVDQSAISHVKDMNTPLLIFQGTNDGSTEWLQGVEFYNALRFNKKPVIFLSYEGEGHGFTRYDNQYDVQVRMKQFYDHHLKGAPAAEWIANGIPFIKKKTPTGAAAQPVQLMGGGAGIGTPMTGGGGAGAGAGTPPPIVPQTVDRVTAARGSAGIRLDGRRRCTCDSTGYCANGAFRANANSGRSIDFGMALIPAGYYSIGVDVGPENVRPARRVRLARSASISARSPSRTFEHSQSRRTRRRRGSRGAAGRRARSPGDRRVLVRSSDLLPLATSESRSSSRRGGMGGGGAWPCRLAVSVGLYLRRGAMPIPLSANRPGPVPAGSFPAGCHAKRRSRI